MFEKFKFKMFNPKAELLQYANSILSKIMDSAPVDSHCDAKVVRQGENYSASIAIASTEGHFSAETEHTDPWKALEIVEAKVRSKIKTWLASRKLFAPRATRLIGNL